MDDDQHAANTGSEYSQRHSSDVPENWNELLFTWAGKSFSLEIADSDR